ncbi:growth-regulating factor [Trifolium repens]|nr:growth-regulating factor [Trifolium repens]
MSEFHVQDTEPNKKTNNNNSNTSSSVLLGSGVKLQCFEGFSNKNMMLQQQQQNHQHRSFSFDHHHDSSAVPDGYGPTTYNISFVGDSDSSALDATTTIDNGAVPLNLQPFHNISATTTLKPSVGMAASLGYPFTISQWKELERQAMIYKYLMASLPVPSHLLSLDGGFNLRLSSINRSNNDPEAGRCKRTDGKKWRCSRDVAPNNKYCERHMHRGRPRSRKPVELQTNDNNHHQIKRARCDSNPFSVPDVTLAMPNPSTRKYGGSTAFHPYHQSSLSLDNNSFGIKPPNFDFSNKQPRGLEWMLNGDPICLGASNSGWHSLMHNNKLGLTNESSYQNNTESQYLNSFPLYTTSELSQHPMQTLQSEKPRGFTFIDAWSNAETIENNANTNNNVSATSIGKLSLSSLDLSMGGPLAEVLRPSNVTSISDATNSNPSSPVGTNYVESIGTSGGTGMFSSPSGVLHNKTLASFSDSSGNSSPTIASSRVNSEIALLNKFDQISYVN